MSDLFDQTTQLDLIPEITASEEDPKLKEISDLSKQGYAFLKENNIEKAIDSFNKISKIDDNNNYALVGLGDSQRKQRHFTEATD